MENAAQSEFTRYFPELEGLDGDELRERASELLQAYKAGKRPDLINLQGLRDAFRAAGEVAEVQFILGVDTELLGGEFCRLVADELGEWN